MAAARIVISVLSLALGLFVYRKPELVIRMQQKFYALINWRMEPISMSKEIRNTRWMGMFLILFVLLVNAWNASVK